MARISERILGTGHEVGNARQDRISVHCKEVGGYWRTQKKPTQKLEEAMKLHTDASSKLNQEPCEVSTLPPAPVYLS